MWWLMLIPLAALGLYVGGLWYRRGYVPETLSGSYYHLGSTWRPVFTIIMWALGIFPLFLSHSWLLVMCALGMITVGLGPWISVRYERLVYVIAAGLVLICSQLWLYTVHSPQIMVIPWIVMTLYFLITRATKWVLAAELIVILSIYSSVMVVFGV